MTPSTFSGFTGFLHPLGSRASLGTDLVFVSLFVVLPVLAWSIHLVRSQKRYQLHKRVQVSLSIALLVAIVVFEIDMRFLSDWQQRAIESPYWPGGVWQALGIHLFFAISTVILWTWVIWEALRQFPVPPQPGTHSTRHKVLARLAAADLLLTSVSGWVFYWIAFVAG